MSARLRAFGIAMTREGRHELFTFYAATRATALAMALEWARRRGWTVEERV